MLVADEPVSALDVSTRTQVIELINELRAEHGLALVMVSHDLGAVAATCERTAVLEGGRVVETGATGDLLARPREAYTQRLISAIPRLPTDVSRTAAVGRLQRHLPRRGQALAELRRSYPRASLPAASARLSLDPPWGFARAWSNSPAWTLNSPAAASWTSS